MFASDPFRAYRQVHKLSFRILIALVDWIPFHFPLIIAQLPRLLTCSSVLQPVNSMYWYMHLIMMLIAPLVLHALLAVVPRPKRRSSKTSEQHSSNGLSSSSTRSPATESKKTE